MLTELRRRINKGLAGYTENALTFRSAVEDTDRSEDRALQLRKKLRKSIAAPEVPTTRALPDGTTVSVFARPPSRIPRPSPPPCASRRKRSASSR